MRNKPKILIYDIETLYLTGHFWRLGEQSLRHQQLSKHRDVTEIVCITYIFNDGKPAKALVFDYGVENSMTNMLVEFDKLAKDCDAIIGKNSDRFDNKHINFQRLMSGLPGNPEWLDQCDDLEKQMRKYFNISSQSLDFWSKKLNLGGKIKMEWDDWVAIEEGHTVAILENNLADNPNSQKALNVVSQYFFKEKARAIIEKGRKALKKMVTYGKKDVADTLALIDIVTEHVTFKFNRSKAAGNFSCRRCGSSALEETYRRQRGVTLYQYFHCTEHNGSAGKLPVKKDGTYNRESPLS